MADDANKEKQLKAQFEKDFQLAKKFNEPIHMRMDKNYELYRNRDKVYEDFRTSSLFSYVETVVPFIVNNRVRGTVKAEYPEYVQHAEGMGYILDHTFDQNNWDYNAQRIAKMAEIYRYSLAYAGYDAEAKNGTGKLCIYEINPRWCYVDPAVTELQDSSFFFYAEPMRMTKAMKLHPDKADEIKKSVNRTEGGGTQSRKWFQTFQDFLYSVKSAITFNSERKDMRAQEYQEMTEMDEAEKRRESVAYIHYWYRDDNDKWRVSYWADEVFLEDRPNPFWHAKLPYVPYVPCEDILSAVGVPIAEQIEQLNWERNVLIEEVIANIKRANRPPAVRNTAYGNLKDPRALSEPQIGSEVIDVNNPDFVPLNAIFDYLNVPQIAPGTFALNDVLEALEDKLLGTNDTMRGLGDATSGKEVQLKQEAAYTRIKTKVDNFEKFVKELSEMIIVNSMQFLEGNRAFRVKGDYRQYEDMNEDETPFNVEPIPRGRDRDTGKPIHDKKEFFLYANPNEWTKLADEGTHTMPDGSQMANTDMPAESDKRTEENVQEAFRILQFVVEIEAGSSLATSRMARREEAMELFEAGVVDQQYILDAFEVADAEEIMRRMSEAVQAQQEAEAQAEQAKMQMEMQMKQMEIDAKLQQQIMQNRGDVKQERIEQGQPADIGALLQQIRQQFPEAQQLSDEQLIQAFAGQQAG